MAFLIYNEGTYDEIAQHANRHHALLKFTHEKSQTKMQFLDVLVFKGPRFRETGILDLTTFRKKTENYQCLERSSCHPSSTLRGIIKGEMLRFKRCTNDPVDLQTQYALFSERLIKMEYPKNEIKTVIPEVTAKQRNDTLMARAVQLDSINKDADSASAPKDKQKTGEDTKRTREFSEKAQEQYNTRVKVYVDKLDQERVNLQALLEQLSESTLEQLDDIKGLLKQSYEQYISFSDEYLVHLRDKRTHESRRELSSMEKDHASCEKLYKDQYPQPLREDQKTRAKLETTQAKVKLAEEEAALEKRMSTIRQKTDEEHVHADFKLLQIKKEAVQAEVEAKVEDADRKSFNLGKHHSRQHGQSNQKAVIARKTQVNTEKKTLNNSDHISPVHGTPHSLNVCREFSRWDMSKRKEFLKSKGICFKCCETINNMMKDCTQNVKCQHCQSLKHSTVMHIERREQNEWYNKRTTNSSIEPQSNHGGESTTDENKDVVTKCTSLCDFTGRSCSKTVLVKIFPSNKPEKAVTTNAILDEHSNKTLACSELMDLLGVDSTTLMLCWHCTHAKKTGYRLCCRIMGWYFMPQFTYSD
ncbi:unnamed protein product [Mytilus coruscus]|uniref:Helix-turn-helix domain-containing protein n=1 Tax=Mytilus coruscus TaxID=42192 RepID=A0A6J8BFX5_MYTCO|nr:unnamed protein product [Mytilus coruscus]